MSRKNYTFTSESVSEGHPDKVSDRISDEVVDLFLRRAHEEKGNANSVDPWDVRVAAETLTTTNCVVIAGETRGPSSITNDEVEAVARAAIKDIGYEQDGFHHANAKVEVLLHGQSAHIAQGVDNAAEAKASGDNEKLEGAGDQGIMFGYASNETDALMPAPLHYSQIILRELAAKRHSGELDQLGPDSKSQVSVVYENGKPVRASSIVLSTQHAKESQTSSDIREMVEGTIRSVLPQGWVDNDTVWHVNPTGSFVIGGPDGDAGLTGRKIIVDTYGGAAPHGGGAFSGKDSTKVDRSAAYAARYLAKNIVAAELSDVCTIQLSYAIGVAQPLSVYVDTGGNTSLDEKLESVIANVMDLTPTGIRTKLGLTNPIFARTAAYGHFGREPEADGGFSWERTDLVAALQAAV